MALRERGLTVRRADTRDLQHARELAAEAAGGGETVVADCRSQEPPRTGRAQ